MTDAAPNATGGMRRDDAATPSRVGRPNSKAIGPRPRKTTDVDQRHVVAGTIYRATELSNGVAERGAKRERHDQRHIELTVHKHSAKEHAPTQHDARQQSRLVLVVSSLEPHPPRNSTRSACSRDSASAMFAAVPLSIMAFASR